MKKILYPIVTIVLSFIIHVIKLIVFNHNSELGPQIVMSLLWIICFLPVSSFVYSKVILRNSKERIVFPLLHSVLIVLPQLLFIKPAYIFSFEAVLLILKYFAWCEVWALLGLIGKRADKQIEEQLDEQPDEQ